MDYILIITNNCTTGNSCNYYLNDEVPKTPKYGTEQPGTVGNAFKRQDWAGNWKRYRK